MDFKSYFFSLPKEAREQLAQECSCSLKHLINVAYGCKTPSRYIAVQVEAFSHGLITREQVRQTSAEDARQKE